MRRDPLYAAAVCALAPALGIAAEPARAPGATLPSAKAAPASTAAAAAPARATAADLDLLEFLGGDDELDAELGEYLARPRPEDRRERAAAPVRPAPPTNGSERR